MPSKSCHLVDVGIDYLTATYSGRKASRKAAHRAFDLIEQEMAQGNYRKPWGMAGFHGYQCGSLQVGHRNDDVLVRLSSHMAHEHWREFSESADNISRADYQVTTRSAEAPAQRINRAWRQARRFKRDGHSKAAVGAYFGDDSVPTVYLGRRVSDRFGRIYDKWRESQQEEWHDCVRFEVEYKNDAAGRQIRSLLRSSSHNTEIAGNCRQFFCDRGVRLEGILEGLGNYSCIRSICTQDKQLRWLRNQVKGVVGQLALAGKLSEVEKALGLKIDHYGNLMLSGPSEMKALDREVA